MIGIGALTFGFSVAGDTASLTHLWADGGFAPKGTWQVMPAIGSLIVLMSVLSWTKYTPGVSPFVQVFAQVGIPAAGIMHFVVLTAALSSCNVGVFSTGRMLRGLALER